MATPLGEFKFNRRESLDRSTEGIDFGTRDAQRLLPLPATATLAQDDSSDSDPRDPIRTRPLTGETTTLGRNNPFTLTGPLDPDRTSDSQKSFLDAAGAALKAGDKERILSLFGEQGTGLGVFEDLSDKFVGNLALQVFPNVFSEFFQGDPGGAQKIFRIQQLLAGLTPGTEEANAFRPPGTSGTPTGPGPGPAVAPPPGGGGGGPGTGVAPAWMRSTPPRSFPLRGTFGYGLGLIPVRDSGVGPIPLSCQPCRRHSEPT